MGKVAETLNAMKVFPEVNRGKVTLHKWVDEDKKSEEVLVEGEGFVDGHPRSGWPLSRYYVPYWEDKQGRQAYYDGNKWF